MHKNNLVALLAGLAVTLVVIVVGAAVVSPWALMGLAPALFAVAAILRAVGGQHVSKSDVDRR